MTGNPLLDVDRRLVVAHRGASANAPENTLPSFQLAVEQGADAIELDVRVTRDGVPVVLHDASLARTTGTAALVADISAERVSRADAGARFSPDDGRTFPWRGRGVRIPTLAEVLEAVRLPLLIELKEARGQEAVRRLLEARSAADRVVVASADWHALAAFRGSEFSLGASRREIVRLVAAAWTGWRPRAVAYRALSVPHSFHGMPVPTPRFIAAAHRLGCPVHVWTVDDPTTARRLWSHRTSGIVTNVPDVMVAVRQASPLATASAANP